MAEMNARRYSSTIGTVAPTSRRTDPAKNVKGTGRSKLSRPRMTREEADAFLIANAADQTSVELAFVTGFSTQIVINRCHELGLKWKNGFTNETPLNAEDDFEPAPLPEGETFGAPGGSSERVAKLRDRCERGVELWDAKDTDPQLPRCLAKFEQPEVEPLL